MAQKIWNHARTCILNMKNEKLKFNLLLAPKKLKNLARVGNFKPKV